MVTPRELIEVLVAQALDDLDEDRLTVADALRTLGEAAWSAGYEAGRRG